MVLVIRSDSEIAKSINRSKLIRVQKQVIRNGRPVNTFVWVNPDKNKAKTGHKKITDDKLDFENPRSNGIGGNPMNGETGIRWSISDMDDNELVIDNVFVSPNDRNKGLGKKLVNAAINYGKEKGFKTIGIYAEPQTDDAMDLGELIQWYRNIGFESDPDADELMSYEL